MKATPVRSTTTTPAPVQKRTPPPAAEPGLGLRELQGLAGNRAVSGAVVHRTAPGTQVAAAPPEPSTTQVQREPTKQGAVWTAPEDFGNITDKGGARVVLGELTKTAGEYSSIGIGDVAAQAKELTRALGAQQARLTGAGLLTEDEAAALQPVALLYQGFLNNAHAALREAVTKGLAGLFNPPDLEENNAAIREAMHELFLKPDEDKLKAIAELAETVKGMAESSKSVAEKAKFVATQVGQIGAATKLHEITAKLDELKAPLAKALEIKKTAGQLITIARNAGAEGGVVGAADALEAGVDLSATLAGKVQIGGVGLLDAVPFFSTYWNDYVVPMTKKCLDMLRTLAAKSEKWNRDQLDHLISWVPTAGGWRPVGPPPELPAAMYVGMGVSRPMFEFLYLARQGNQPPMTAEVRKNLMGKRAALEALSGNTIELEPSSWWNPLSWFGKEAKDLPGWVAANISTVWAAYLGAAGR